MSNIRLDVGIHPNIPEPIYHSDPAVCCILWPKRAQAVIAAYLAAGRDRRSGDVTDDPHRDAMIRAWCAWTGSPDGRLAGRHAVLTISSSAFLAGWEAARVHFLGTQPAPTYTPEPGWLAEDVARADARIAEWRRMMPPLQDRGHVK